MTVYPPVGEPGDDGDDDEGPAWTDRYLDYLVDEWG